MDPYDELRIFFRGRSDPVRRKELERIIMTVESRPRTLEERIKFLEGRVKSLDDQFVGIQTRDLKKTSTRYIWPHILADYNLPQLGTGKWQKRQHADIDRS